MELLDIVDAHDEIIGQKERNVVHKNKLLHRGITILIFNPQGKLYIQQRSADKDTFPLHFEGSISGHVQSGETYHQAAVRELREELSIIITPGHVHEVEHFGYHEDDERMLVTLYVVKDYHGPITVDHDEVTSGEFWTLEQVKKEITLGKKLFHPSFLKALEIFEKTDGKAQDYVTVKKTKRK